MVPGFDKSERLYNCRCDLIGMVEWGQWDKENAIRKGGQGGTSSFLAQTRLADAGRTG
jgi:hypothetical protein